MKKEKVKKFVIKTMWCILWLLVIFILMFSFRLGFMLVITNTYSLLGVIFLISSYFMIDLSLYIYSYKVYIGKYNWYKFFREKEKQQQKQNGLEWKEYCNSLKTKK